MSFRPLDGKRVLDVTTSLAGPYCTEILAALGADVVKVEPPEGDFTRTWGPPFWNGESTMFLAANAGKRSVALSLAHPDGLEAVLRLAEGADVFVQSLRPGLAERRGLGRDALRGRNPDLVYCTIGSYGRVGPLKDLPGYDPMMQATAGIVSVTGETGRSGVRVGVSLLDQGTGQWAALGIVAALLGGGARDVDVSLYETAIGLLPYQIAGYLGAGEVPGRQGSAFSLIAPYQVFQAADGDVMIAAANDKLFRSLCDALDLPIGDDPRFRTNPERVANRAELVGLIEGRLAERPVAEWLERLTAAGVPAAPVHDVGEVAEHEQTQALGLLQPLPHATVPDLRLVAPPLSFDGERALLAGPPPLLGEHTREVLAEAGFSEEEIERVLAASR